MPAVPKPVGVRAPDFLTWLNDQMCDICTLTGQRQETRSEAAHTPRVRIHGDAENAIPLCHAHHAEEEQMQPEAFGAKYGVVMRVRAKQWWRRYLNRRAA